MTRPMRVAQIVKYYHPSERISGVIGFLTALNRHLGDHVDLTVITSAFEGAPPLESKDSYRIVRVPWPFPARAAGALARLNPAVGIYVSSIYQRRLAALYFGGCHIASRVLGRRGRVIYFQATHLSEGKSWMFSRFLHTMDEGLYAAPDAPIDFRQASRRFGTLLPAVDLASLQPRLPRKGVPRVGFVNHLNSVKGFDRALEMFSHVANGLEECEFVIAGTGELQHLVPDRIGKSRVERHGWLGDSERMQVMASCDLVLFPFRTGVSVLGLSQTVIECMAIGVVPIGTRTPSIEPLILDSVDGILYDREGEAVARIIGLLNDYAALRAMSEAARQKIAHHYDASIRAHQLANRLAN